MKYRALVPFRWGTSEILGGRHIYYRRDDIIELSDKADPPPHCVWMEGPRKGDRTPLKPPKKQAAKVKKPEPEAPEDDGVI